MRLLAVKCPSEDSIVYFYGVSTNRKFPLIVLLANIACVEMADSNNDPFPGLQSKDPSRIPSGVCHFKSQCPTKSWSCWAYKTREMFQVNVTISFEIAA